MSVFGVCMKTSDRSMKEKYVISGSCTFWPRFPKTVVLKQCFHMIKGNFSEKLLFLRAFKLDAGYPESRAVSEERRTLENQCADNVSDLCNRSQFKWRRINIIAPDAVANNTPIHTIFTADIFALLIFYTTFYIELSQGVMLCHIWSYHVMSPSYYVMLLVHVMRSTVFAT